MKVSQSKIIIFILIFTFIFKANLVYAEENYKNQESPWDYPRIANIFIDSYLHPDEGKLLSNWDLLILGSEAQEWRPDVFKAIREKNPDIIILAYVSISGISDHPSEFNRFKTKDPDVIPDNWWLKSSSGEGLGYWPEAHMLNVTDLSPTDSNGLRWNDWLADWTADNIYSTGFWDGIFFDEAFPAMSWLNGGDIDLDGDGEPEDAETINSAWSAGVEKITFKLRERIGPNAYIMVNGASIYTKNTNGRMHEEYFTDDNWSEEMNDYIGTYNNSVYTPKISLINFTSRNTGIIDPRRRLFSYTSTLLGNGFFSHDFGSQRHMDMWWLDEYDIFLGQPLSKASNLIGSNDQGFIPGLWRRDFDHGTVLVNSTDEHLEYEIVYNKKILNKSLEAYSGIIVTLEEFNQSGFTKEESTKQNKINGDLNTVDSPVNHDDEKELLTNGEKVQGRPLYGDMPPDEYNSDLNFSTSTDSIIEYTDFNYKNDLNIIVTNVSVHDDFLEHSSYFELLFFRIKEVIINVYYPEIKNFLLEIKDSIKNIL